MYICNIKPIKTNNIMETKKCAHCGRVLPISEFYKNSRSKDGYSFSCKECRHEMEKASRERMKTGTTMYTRKKKTVISRPIVNVEVKQTSENILAKVTPRELMEELNRRGYKGVLEYTEVHRIDISNF